MKNKNNWIIVVVIVILALLVLWPSWRRSDENNDLTTNEEEAALGDEGATSTDDDVTGESPISLDEVEISPVNTNANVTTPAAGAGGSAVDQLMSVKVFFPKQNDTANNLKCDKAYPVTRRVAKTPAVARAALVELLKGLTSADATLNYMTAINPGVMINSLMIENGVAKVDFNIKLNEGVAGSCRVEAIRAQIESTLKQFPTVKSVRLSVNGQTEGILQP